MRVGSATAARANAWVPEIDARIPTPTKASHAVYSRSPTILYSNYFGELTKFELHQA